MVASQQERVLQLWLLAFNGRNDVGALNNVSQSNTRGGEESKRPAQTVGWPSPQRTSCKKDLVFAIFRANLASLAQPLQFNLPMKTFLKLDVTMLIVA